MGQMGQAWDSIVKSRVGKVSPDRRSDCNDRRSRERAPVRTVREQAREEEEMDRPNDRIAYLKRARRTIRAVALGLVVSGFGTTAALADVCQFSDGSVTYGPCVQFENKTSRYNLYCLQGPTSKSHKIIINPGDSFTCKVPTNRR